MPEAPPDPAAVAIVLAAGESRRMGAPKLLLPLDGETLLARAVRRGAAVAGTVVAVVGAYPERYRGPAEAAGARVVVNEGWAAGLGGTIRAGVAALPAGAERALLLLPDQPFVPPAHLAALLAAVRGGAELALSRYGDGNDGVPAALAATLFGAAAALPDDCGARALRRSAASVASRPLEPAAEIDVDTPAAARRWLGDPAADALGRDDR